MNVSYQSSQHGQIFKVIMDGMLKHVNKLNHTNTHLNDNDLKDKLSHDSS